MRQRDIERQFSTQEACLQALVEARWPDKVHCPKCGMSTKVYRLKTRPFRWVCRGECGNYGFSPLVGTIFENTNVPLPTWFRVMYLMCVSKKGISAMQVQRMIEPSQGGKTEASYRTAWYMCHRIRAAMQSDEFKRLAGVVEVDETFVGGKAKNRRYPRKPKRLGPGGRPLRRDKGIVIGAISRKGNVTAKVVQNLGADAIGHFVREAVSDRVSLFATDQATIYDAILPTDVPHESVNHQAGEYVRGRVHTSTIDGFWSLLKRGIMGSFHQVSKDYLPLYVNEFAFRYNHRDNPNIFKTVPSSC
jgi:hypothetical protein